MQMTTRTNLDNRFAQTAARQPDHPAVAGSSLAAPLTYGELDRAIGDVAERLQRAGLHSGDAVGLHCASGLDYIVFNYAIWRCGGCVVPIAIELAADEQREICRRIGVTHVILQSRSRRVFEPLVDGQPVEVGRGELLAALNEPREHPEGFAAVDAAFIRFTSGTTGSSKGVVLSHTTIAERIAAANEELRLGPDDRVVWLLSMSYHFAVSIVGYLSSGATIILPASTLAASVLDDLQRHQGTVMYGSPVHYAWMADSGRRGPLPSLRLALSTTTALDSATARRFCECFGVPLSQALGVIEIGLPAINVDFAAAKPASVGRVLPAYQLQLEDAGLAPGLGTVALRGPGFLDAYYDPWQTAAEIMPDGWFRTGDVGELDADGCLYLRGRAKDVIDVMGMKFFPQEVERILASHPAVAAACVVARPHPRLGEVPHAQIVARHADRPPGEAELREHCRGRLADFKVPVQFEFVDSLRQTASGKLLHRTSAPDA